MLRIMDPSNISSSAGVTMFSDGQGLAGLDIAYNGPIPTILTSGTAGPGQVVMQPNSLPGTTGYGGAISLSNGYYTYPLNMATIGNGKMLLGNDDRAGGTALLLAGTGSNPGGGSYPAFRARVDPERRRRLPLRRRRQPELAERRRPSNGTGFFETC